MKYFQLLGIMALAVLTSSCATILTGTTQRVTIDSTPPGADIIVDGRMMGTTPARIRMDRELNAFIDNGKDIQLFKDGYISDAYYIGTDIEPVCILNVFCPPGFALDAVTGAIMKYDSDYYNFRLIPLDPQAPQPTAATQPADEGPDDYEKLMNLVELYEKGMITEEEFEKEKAKIIADQR